jgi:predicted Zn-dependent peptidase
MKYQKSTLDNGITLLTVPIPDSESVVVNFFVKTGSRNEPKKLRGVSHFLEHLFFKGTKKYPTAQDLSSAVEAIGAEYNAATSKEYTVFYIKAAAAHLPFIFDVLSDMLLRPILDEAEIEREKGVILEEMRMYRDTPMRYVPDLLEELMWPASDLGAQIIGDEKTVMGISRKNILDYLAKYYVNPNLILAVAGKFSETELHRLINKYWHRGKTGTPSVFRRAPAPVARTQVKLEYKKTEQAHLALGFYGVDYNSPDVFGLDVLCNVLGGGMSSRLFSEIRERRGLAYYVRASQGHYQDTGSIVISAGLRLGKVEEALALTAAELKKLCQQKVASRELKKAKENLKGRMTLALEDSESRLEWYLEQAAFCRKILNPRSVFQAIDAVTPEQLLKLAQKVFNKRNFRLALIGPFRGREQKFKKLIKL